MGSGGFVVIALASVEDEVGRKENERDGGRESGQERGGFDVQFAGEGRIGLAIGRFAKRGAMDDELRFCSAKAWRTARGSVRPRPPRVRPRRL